MAGNFDFLHKIEEMDVIAQAAEDAEKAFQIGPGACCLLSRRAADYALRWMLDNDSELKNDFSQETNGAPDKADMWKMIQSDAFRDRIAKKARRNVNSIRKSGNDAAHKYKSKLGKKDAEKSLADLHYFLRWLNYNYNNDSTSSTLKFEKSLLSHRQPQEEPKTKSSEAQNSARKNASLQIFTYETLADSLGQLIRTEREKVNKVVCQMVRTKKLNPGFEVVADAEDENIFMLPVDRYFTLYLIVYWQAEVCGILYAAEKEKAIQWSKTIKCEVNVETNELQVFRAAMPGSKNITPETDRVQENLDELRKYAGKFIFQDYDPETLLSLGVPEEYILTMYDVTAETWPLMKDRLPGQAFDCLTLVLNGIPVERVIKETYGGNKDVQPDEIEVAANNPQAGFVKVESEEEVMRMLEAPLEKWRVFLHPQQRRLAYRHYAGAARVLGGAGTGKSVVAIHHAKFLASDSAPDYSILFTTFTTALTDDLKNRLKSICTHDEYKKITVINLDKLISDLLKAIKGKFNRSNFDDGDIINAWQKSIIQSGIDFKEEYNCEFFKDEWINVVQAQDIGRLDDYLVADRQGRGKRVDRETRKKLWMVFKKYSQIMEEAGWLDRDAAANHCCHEIQKDPALRRYDSIIVDESPDFGPAQFRLLRALCGEPHADDLYITGDPRQQIYPNRPKLVLSRCNINVRGRSTQLILNYRTTGNILAWANRLLRGIEYDDLDGNTANMETTISTVEGERPELKKFSTRSQELNYVARKIADLISRGVHPGEIAVIARTNRVWEECWRVLGSAGIPVDTKEIGGAGTNGVQCGTMHGCKGCEFSYVFVIGANKDIIPNKKSLDSAPDAEEKERRINQEKQLLHVALTRARHQVYLTCSGEPSEFLKLLELE